MQLYENNTCSFVIKVWVEPNDDPTALPVWRGHITHVGSERRQYFQELATVLAFVNEYLKNLGIVTDDPNGRS